MLATHTTNGAFSWMLSSSIMFSIVHAPLSLVFALFAAQFAFISRMNARHKENFGVDVDELRNIMPDRWKGVDLAKVVRGQ